MSTIRNWLAENRAIYEDRRQWMKDCSRQVGVTLKAVENMAPRVWPASREPAPTPAMPKPRSKISGRTLDDFRREHDQSWKIRDGVKRLFAGGVIMTDAEFREAVSGNPQRWKAAADATEFADNRYRVQGEVYWASKDTIREMRRIRGEAI